ncbi:hypothetical protein PRZ48_014632 [Zasmidium cellare]|uniref:VOC domain-containing protein n=1 Tax=Zasmidium cellare TaxID=395010 RepID=A0ABR0DYT9_ZASCE|nr:hypothetical protein PRZ48_014632 [Zasmidium cellare]
MTDLPPTRVNPTIENSPSKIQLLRISHAQFEHPDLALFSRFAADFGFVEVGRNADSTKIYYGGYGTDPFCYIASQSPDGKARFHGPGFVAASKEDFEKACKLEGAEVKDLSDAPGGGEMVTIARPNGTFFSVLYGQKEKHVDASTAEVPTATTVDMSAYNYPFHKPRKARFQRLKEGPALVHKLGHFGYISTTFDQDYAFYTSTFNFAPSDIAHVPEDETVDMLVFMHLDLGKGFSDHHCMFLGRAPPGSERTFLHHSSYEVNDYDEQMMGHRFLAAKGWESVWGVGRHILGSQVFDYWHDPSGFKIEHYADGDVVNEEHVVTREAAGPVHVWGPDLPKTFFMEGTLVGYG